MASDPGARRAEGGLTRKGGQTRQRIVTAAADLILQQGVAGTTLDDVRAEAGVSSSQIYHYFADKQALVHAVVDYRAQTVVGAIHEPMLAAIEGIGGLRAWRDKIVSVQEDAGCQGGCPLGSLGSELAELDHVARGDCAAGCSRWEAAIRACLHGMRDRGQLVPAADPGQLATAMLAALQGGLLLAQIERSVRPLAAALDVMILITYHGAGGPAPEEAQQAMAAFTAWASSAGEALADPGAPLGPVKTVSAGSVSDGPADGPANGYSIVPAADLDRAVDLVKNHPFISRGGSLQVSTAVLPG